MPVKPAKDEKNITVWGAPDEKVVAFIGKPGSNNGKIKRIKLLSGYGDITYRDWCGLELIRMKSTTDNVHIVTRERDGMIALARIR